MTKRARFLAQAEPNRFIIWDFQAQAVWKDARGVTETYPSLAEAERVAANLNALPAHKIRPAPGPHIPREAYTREACYVREGGPRAGKLVKQEPKQPKEVRRAVDAIQRQGIGHAELAEAVVFLLDQLATIEHMQDREGIEKIRKKFAQPL